MAAPMVVLVLLVGLQPLVFLDQVDAEGNEVLSVQHVAFLIRSQPNEVHAKRAEQTRASIQSQCRKVSQHDCDVLLIHEKYQNIGSWILLPLLPRFLEDFPNKKWLFFCEEETQVNVAGLLDVLQNHNASQPLFLGKSLVDQRPSIIHHYKFHEDITQFKFPDFEAGWLISQELLRELSERWKEEPAEISFSIDVKHEVALYIWNEDDGVKLTNVPELCADGDMLQEVYSGEGCVTQHHRKINQCLAYHCSNLPLPSNCPFYYSECQCTTKGDPVPQEKVLFVVKTCEQYHDSRVPVVVNTWGQFTDHVIYFSDVTDNSIPTVAAKTANVERGHCTKTLEILTNFQEDIKQQDYDWLVIADDDTILSVARLLKLLSCYDSSKDVFLGERYGYGHGRMFGYDYITGGGGMVLSRGAVSTFISNNIQCSRPEDPDDMILGMFAKNLDIKVTHSPLFHQSQPQQYALGYLKHQLPISFHKHSNLDPYDLYQEWFYADDDAMRRKHEKTASNKDEL